MAFGHPPKSLEFEVVVVWLSLYFPGRPGNGPTAVTDVREM